MNSEDNQSYPYWKKGLMYEKHAGIRFLLAAIVIILVLSIIAVPFPLKARRQAQTNACVNCLHAIEAAKDEYSLEFGIPLDRVFTPDMITLYLKDTTHLRCPLAPASATNWTDSYSIGSLTNNAQCRIAPLSHRIESKGVSTSMTTTSQDKYVTEYVTDSNFVIIEDRIVAPDMTLIDDRGMKAKE